jgi:hypothetical protein
MAAVSDYMNTVESSMVTDKTVSNMAFNLFNAFRLSVIRYTEDAIEIIRKYTQYILHIKYYSKRDYIISHRDRYSFVNISKPNMSLLWHDKT